MDSLNFWKSFFAGIVYIVCLESIGLVFLLSEFIPDSVDIETSILISQSLFLVGHLGMLLLVYFVLKKYIFGTPTLINSTHSKKWLYGLIAIFSSVVLLMIHPYIGILFDSIQGFPKSDQTSIEIEKFQLWKIPQLASSIIILPILEELFFRGFILNGLLKNKKTINALLISSLIFGALHFVTYPFEIINLKYAFFTFLGGMIAGTLYIKTKNIVFPIIFHVSWNLLANLNNYIVLPWEY